MASEKLINWSLLQQFRLYDRDEQKHVLEDRYERIVSGDQDQAELVLITGPSGNGKTALAGDLKDTVRRRGGFFIRGKFDQLQKPESFAPFVAAFTEYVQQVKEKEAFCLDVLAENINSALEGEGKLVTQMIPALEEIMGVQPELHSAVIGFEARTQLKRVFRKFVRSLCSTDQPLVLFIDDLQWANKECLDLLSALLADRSFEGLMIIGACRGNEVSVSDELSVTLRMLEDDYGVSITEIPVGNLSQMAILDMITDLSGSISQESRKQLAEFVFEQTEGNPFYTIQLLCSLPEDSLVCVDDVCVSIDISKFRSTSSPDVVGFMRAKILRLSEDVQEMLKVAACVGAEFDHALMEYVSCDCFKVAVDTGLIVPVKGSLTRYAFVHDKVQQASYSLIEDRDKAAFHLTVGRQLWNSLDGTDLITNARTVVSVLLPGMDLIECEEERASAAQLCLYAGKQLKEVSSFRAAATHFETGRELLGRRPWRDHYFLTLALFHAAAEVEYVIGNNVTTEILLEEIIAHARSFQDKLPAYTTKIYSLGTQNRLQEAIDVGLFVLRQLNEPLPRNAQTRHIVVDLLKTKMMLRGLSNKDILSLDTMVDERALSAMRVLNVLFSYVFMARPNYAPLVAMRQLQITLRHGISAMSSPSFSFYGLMLCSFGQIKQALRYGELALLMQDKFQRNEWLARVYLIVYGGIRTAKVPMRDCIEPLRFGHKTGLASGDSEFAMLCAHLCSTCSLFSSQPLPDHYIEQLEFREEMLTYRQDGVLALHEPQVQFVSNLLGGTQDALALTGRFINEKEALRVAKGENNLSVLISVYMMKIAIAYIMNDYKRAEEASLTMRKEGRLESITLFGQWWVMFFEGITYLALARKSRGRSLRRRRKAHRFLQFFKRCSCPHNLLNRIFFMEAEFEVIHGNIHQAIGKYERSIELARGERLLLEQALACERAAMTLMDNHRTHDAIAFFTEAKDVFACYGAKVKVEKIERTLASIQVGPDS